MAVESIRLQSVVIARGNRVTFQCLHIHRFNFRRGKIKWIPNLRKLNDLIEISFNRPRKKILLSTSTLNVVTLNKEKLGFFVFSTLTFLFSTLGHFCFPHIANIVPLKHCFLAQKLRQYGAIFRMSEIKKYYSFVMCSMKRDHKSAELIIKESEKLNSGQNEHFLVFCRNRKIHHLRTCPQNIRVCEWKFLFVLFLSVSKI